MAEAAVRQREPQTARQSRRDTPFFEAGGRERGAQNKEQQPNQPVNKRPDERGKLVILKHKIENKTVEQKAHKQSDEIVEGTQNAVSVDPALQQSSQENTTRVREMSEAEPRPFDAARFEASIIENVEKVIPKTKSELDRDPTSRERMQAANREMNATLQSEQGHVTGEIESAQNISISADNIEIHQPDEMVTDEIGSVPQIRGAGIAPPLHSEEETDLSEESRQIDESMESNGITEEMLRNGNEPSFAAALDLKQESQSRAEHTRSDYLAEANPLLQTTINSTEQLTTSGVAQMYGMRGAELGSLQTGQNLSRVNEEVIRTRVARALDTIYERTKLAVEVKLERLTTTVRARFETALNSANSTFESNVRERTKTGFFETIGRWISGIPKDVERIFHEEQRLFINSLRPVIREIGALMETELNDTMAIIEAGKQEMQNFWNSQDEETQRIAGDLFAAAGERYATLEQQVNDTNSQLQDDITQQFTGAVNALRETFDRIKEENKNWLERARDAVVGVIEAIIEMKNTLMGILRDAADTIMIIIRNPVRFLSNLLNAVKMGFMGFVDKILTYIKEGLITWLLGNMPPGIVFPETWNLKGIFTFVASIIGLTWENIKDRAIRKFGPHVVAALETAFDVFIIIKERGIVGLWEFIKEKLINLKEQVLGAIQEMLITQVIKAGITWVLSLFNPVGAFLKACKLIYDVIVWFVNNARRLLELVRSIVDSVAMIVAGSLNAAAQFIERSLARTVPILIGFLAGLLGIGDLSAKVQKIIDKIREPINNAIDWVLDKAKSIAQRLMAVGRRGVETVAGWLGLRKGYQSKDGKSHELFFEEKNGQTVLMRKSVKMSFVSYMNSIELAVAEYNKNNSDKILLDPIKEKFNFIKNNMGVYNDFKKNEISQKMNELALLLSKLPDNIAAENNIFFPSHSIAFTTKSQSLASRQASVDGATVKVSFLSLKLGDLRGSPGRHTSNLYTHIAEKIKPANRGSLIRGHLLNHYLGGTGDEAKNIAPIAKSTNNAMERNNENQAKERVAKQNLMSGSVFDYEVSVVYAKSEKLVADVPQAITMKIQNRKFKENVERNKSNMEKKDNWKADGAALSHTFSNTMSELEALA